MLFSRIGQFLSTSARHVIPIGGVFGQDWHPATAMIVFWAESALLVLATALLCALMARRTSRVTIDDVRRGGDRDEAKRLTAERKAFEQAEIQPSNVLAFHGGSMLVFLAFFGGVLLILVGNEDIPAMRWDEVQDGIVAMTLAVGAGLTFDLWRWQTFTVADVRRRVDACLVRWSLFWMLGFFGTLIIGISGRATWFFGFFSALKITFESWARLAQMFGWQSVADQNAANQAAAPAATTK